MHFFNISFITIRVRISRMLVFWVLDIWTFELENLHWGTTLANHLVRVGTLTLKYQKMHCWDPFLITYFISSGAGFLKSRNFFSQRHYYSYPIWIKNEAGRTSNGIRNSIYTKIEFITDLERMKKWEKSYHKRKLYVAKAIKFPFTEGSSCAKYPFCRGHNFVGWAGWRSGLPLQSTEKGNEHLAKAVEASSNTKPSGQYLSKICK